MKTPFSPRAWNEYYQWSTSDKKTFKRVYELIEACRRDPFRGIGKPEALKGDFQGWWSRRIDQEHRLVYRVTGKGDNQVIEILQCRGHYE